MIILPEHGLWHSITVGKPVDRSIIRSLTCDHKDTTTFKHVDQANPSPYQDVYEGVVCVACGMMLTNVQTY